MTSPGDQERALELEREKMPRMSLGEHLEELRARLIRIVVLFALLLIVAFIFQDQLANAVMWPYDRVMRDLGVPAKLYATEIQSQFFFYMKVCMLAALFLTAPYALQQLWGFIAAGLYRHEKRYVRFFFPISMGLFVCGMLLGYFVMVPLGMQFLVSYGDPHRFEQITSPSNYFTVLIILTLVLGTVFQLPLVMMFFAKIGLVSPKTYSAKRRYFVLVAFIVGGLLTPPDPVTQIMLAVPMLGLYEVGILFSKMSFAPHAPPEPETET